MNLIFIYGPAASGKLTIARKLCERTGYKLFHNHIVVDALLAVFDFGSTPFCSLRERIWLEIFEGAAVEGASLVFTFTPERTVDPQFIERVVELISRHNGRVRFVKLECPISVLEARMEDASRREFQKLNSVETFRKLREQGMESFPEIPYDHLTIDTSMVDPEEAASLISSEIRKQ